MCAPLKLSDLLPEALTPDGTINTVAGNGSLGYSGEGGPATAAALGSSRGVAVDGRGVLYIADNTYNRVRKVSPSFSATGVGGLTIASEDGAQLK